MKRLLLITLLLSSIYACNKNPFDIDVSNIKVDLKVKRFDIDFFNINQDKIYYEIPELQKKYGDFFDTYTAQLIGIGLPDQKDFYDNLNEFFYYCNQQDLANTVWKTFPADDKFIETTLTNAFKHYKYYFPDKQIPSIITCVSGFNVSVFSGNDFIGISLDKYLGKDFKPYKSMFDNYLIRRMTKEMIPVDVMRMIAVTEFPYDNSSNSLMDKMIYEGKIQYFIAAMLPDVADTLKWGYTELQWGWANEYEKKIWDYMVDQKVLFSHNTMDIKTYTGEAPFTTPFQNNSAPRAGTFIGYKIVESYMENNPDINLQKLMANTKYMDIYNFSYYKP